ncbi:limonoid 21-O-acetyltransferse-like [Rutidosis leptorrhynchoides]|uniref:limonoid 21-O-acetyltransferse-like n=1 Tax=Rutidosis leptorrhynchoides TaxID=125765 RepID=UPI003A98D43B
MEIKVENQSSKFIKPTVPTPETHCRFKLGFLDEIAPCIDVAITLFFSPNSNHNPKFIVQLENSLAKTLTRFYPLAGRYAQDVQTIECTDDGVEFIQAKVNVKLEEIIGSEVVDVKLLINEFKPSKNRAAHQFIDPLLSIQVTKFECGSLAIGVCATHKLVDASTLCTFINEWATINREENNIELSTGPGFNSSTLFPARGLHHFPYQPMSSDMLSKHIIKKYTFTGSEISTMKAKVMVHDQRNSTRNQYWSKVQLVGATITKAFISSSVDRTTHEYPREFAVVQALNLRGKMASLIHKHSCGNILAICITKCGHLETTAELAHVLSDSIKKSISKFSMVSLDSEEGQSLVWDSVLQFINIPESTNKITVTSWCKFPFYEANFGTGKPIWVAPYIEPVKNVVYLLDNAQGDGVEAFVFLEIKDVPYFEEALDLNALVA